MPHLYRQPIIINALTLRSLQEQADETPTQLNMACTPRPTIVTKPAEKPDIELTVMSFRSTSSSDARFFPERDAHGRPGPVGRGRISPRGLRSVSLRMNGLGAWTSRPLGEAGSTGSRFACRSFTVQHSKQRGGTARNTPGTDSSHFPFVLRAHAHKGKRL